MIDYYAPLILPSNGLEYEPIVYLRELTVGSILIHYDEFYANMEIGKIISILNRHFKHKDITNISDMYYGDVIYIWNYLCSKSFNINKIKKGFVCKQCEKQKIISIDLKDIDIKYLEKKNVILEFSQNENFTICYRRRKMIDNIHFSFFTLEDDKENFDYVYNYTKHQILYIKDNKNNKQIEKETYREFLNFMGIKQTLAFFKQIRTEDYGFESDYIAICDNCQYENEIKLIDPIDISFFHRGLEISNEEYQDFVELLMTINSLKYITFKELLELPNSKLQIIIDSVKKLQEQKYSKNKGSYFDQMLEDM